MARYCLQFDGASGSYAAPGELSPAQPSIVTYSFWLKTSMTGTGRIFTSHDNAYIPAFIIDINDGKIRAIFDEVVVDPVVKSQSETSINDGKWHHIAIIVGGNGGIYIDSISEGDDIGVLGDAHPVHADNHIGGRAAASGGFVGDIDDFRIYAGEALTESLVALIYNEGIGADVDEDEFAILTDNGFYAAFNDGSGSTFIVQKLTSGEWSELGDVNGDIYGGVTWVEDGVPFEIDRHFCLLADVKTRLGITPTDFDDIIDSIVDGIDGSFDGYTGRKLLLTDDDITEYYGAEQGWRRLLLKRYPIIAITSIKEASDYDFDAATALVANTDYRLVNQGLNGIILCIDGCWLVGEDVIEVIYRGGFCGAGETPSEGEYTLPQDLREAAILQACFLFKRKDDIGLSSISSQGGSISKFADVELLPLVKQILDRYKRPSL